MPERFQDTVAAAKRGERPAFNTLFAQNLPQLRAFIRARVGRAIVSRESVEDLAQSVCREVLLDMDGFEYRGDASFRKWLFVQASRKIIDRHRYLAAEKRNIARDVAEPEGGGLDWDAEMLGCYATMCTPSRHAAAKEELDRIQSFLGRLDDDQRDAVAMSRILGMSYPDIAAQMERSESSVRGLVARGLANLAEWMETG